jgi:hypothetical protein
MVKYTLKLKVKIKDDKGWQYKLISKTIRTERDNFGHIPSYENIKDTMESLKNKYDLYNDDVDYFSIINVIDI